MRKLIFFAFVAIMLASCGTSPKQGIDVLGRWYVYTDDSCKEVDSTNFFEFHKDQTYLRHYHDAGSFENGTYACSNDTKEDYGKLPSKRISLVNQANEETYIDAVKNKEQVMFVITYRMNDKQDILYVSKDKNYKEDK